MAKPIRKVDQRAKLAPRREPYFCQLSQGRFIGYRRLDKGGTWIARAYDPATKKQTYQSLGDLANTPAGEQYDEAVRLAGKFFAHLDGGGVRESMTVAQACEAFIASRPQDAEGKESSATKSDRLRLARFVVGDKRHAPDPIASIDVRKLTVGHVRAWAQRMRNRQTQWEERTERTVKTGPARTARKVSPTTYNRDIAPLRAALNLAKADGFVTTDAAWLDVLAATKDRGTRKTLFLDRAQCLKLEAAAAALNPEFAAFVRAMILLPVRPGALAAARVADFSPDAGTLFIRKDKTKRATGRVIALPPHIAAHFKAQCKGKTPAAFVFCQKDGRPWNAKVWGYWTDAAVKRAGLPDSATLYSLRHATISELVLCGLDWNSLSNLAGTSATMIQDSYAQLRQADIGAALQRIAV